MSIKTLVHAALFVVLTSLSWDASRHAVAYLDDKPVFILTENPTVLTPYIRVGDELRVEWRGHYRKACDNLRYTRWIGLFDPAGNVIELKKREVPASSSVKTEPSTFVFSWTINYPLKPGVYFWRSIEIADCGRGVVHRNWLDDAWFEIVDDDEDTSFGDDYG